MGYVCLEETGKVDEFKELLLLLQGDPVRAKIIHDQKSLAQGRVGPLRESSALVKREGQALKDATTTRRTLAGARCRDQGALKRPSCREIWIHRSGGKMRLFGTLISVLIGCGSYCERPLSGESLGCVSALVGAWLSLEKGAPSCLIGPIAAAHRQLQTTTLDIMLHPGY